MIVTDQQVLDALGKSALTGAEATLMAFIHPRVEKAVCRFLRWNPDALGTSTVYLPPRSPTNQDPSGLGMEDGGSLVLASTRKTLRAPKIPVRSVTSLYTGNWDSAGGSFTTQLNEGSDFRVDWDESGWSWTGFIYRSSGYWEDQSRVYKLVYTHGLDEDEINGEYSDIQLATMQAIIKFFNEIKTHQGTIDTGKVGPLRMERLQYWTQEWDSGLVREIAGMVTNLPISVKDILQPYRNYSGAF